MRVVTIDHTVSLSPQKGVPFFQKKGFRSFMPAAALIGLCLLSSGQAGHAAPAAIALQPVTMQGFSAPPPVWNSTVTPAFQEKKTPLAQAINLKEVEGRIGGLSPAQKAFLEKNRFLLLSSRKLESDWVSADEMLQKFGNIGGSLDPMERQPDNAIFAGPDPFLQALHKYFSVRLKSLEERDLSHAVYSLLQGLYANTVTLRATTTGKSMENWERLQAQILVPLLLMQNSDTPGGKSSSLTDPESIDEATGQIIQTPKRDTLENALKIFEQYKTAFSPKTAMAIATELERIYAADGTNVSTLALVSSHSMREVDYTQFRPRGHYEDNSVTRAYFRAMIWLGQLGWALDSDEGTADAVNFALAMSFDGQKDASGAASKQTDQQGELPLLPMRKAWQNVMEISSFFVGYPDEASYLEWQPYLQQHAGVTAFTPDTATDKTVITNIQANLAQLKPSVPHFKALQHPAATAVLRVFPQRFTVPWLIADQLSYAEESPRDKLPALFSGLWVPATFGSAYARELLEKQVALCLQVEPNASLEGAPVATTQPTQETQEAAKVSTKILLEQMDSLAAGLRKEPETSWFSALGASWLHVLGTLTADYGKGYPLYMQSPFFRAKQLESFMGSYTELKHDTILYEKPNYAEGGEGGDSDNAPPVPKGFVEPNLAFWNEMLRVVSYMDQGFAKYGLFPNDREEYGALSRFRSQLSLCAALAEKELTGTTITDEEYETFRVGMNLQYMAEPVDASTVLTDEQKLSSLIVDVQTVRERAILYEALGEPSLMLVLVGNENTPRLTIGVAFNHQEFVTPYGPRLTDSQWKQRVSGENPQPVPDKNFWYDGLRP